MHLIKQSTLVTVKTLTSIVTGGESSESFLSSSVPDLQFDDVAFVFDCFQFKVYSNCIEKVFVELVISVSK